MLLDDARWQDDLIDLGRTLRPRLFVFDPLARMKSSARDENAQTDMAPLIEYLRILRDETGAAVLFVHHTGHNGERMRGSSDLESASETRLTWKRNDQDPVVEIEAEHREAESSPATRYRIEWDSERQAMRFPLEGTTDREQTLHDRIVAYIAEHPGSSGADIEKAMGAKAEFVRQILKQLVQAGTTNRPIPQAGRTGTNKEVRGLLPR